MVGSPDSQCRSSEGIMKKILLFLVLILSMAIPCVLCAAGGQEISAQRVDSLLKEGSGLWLIDVRSEETFSAAHIEGAINIPLAKLVHKHFPKGRMLVLTDASLGDIRAREAARQLAARQEKVFVLKGGLAEWQRTGLPVSGDIRNWRVVRILPDELHSALTEKTSLRILDLRDSAEGQLSPLKSAEIVGGTDLIEKLGKLQILEKEYASSGLAGELKANPPVVIVLPTGAAARNLYQQYLWSWPGVVRVMEGGYLTSAGQRQTLTISNLEGCPTCPGDIREGEKK